MSRTVNSAKNLVTGVGSELLSVILKFITRTVFIRYLGLSYLGINGLFYNILTMLSLVELDFGVAIVYNLYKPIEQNDRRQIILYMNLYKMIYRAIGCIVLVLGVALIPFLPYIIKDYGRLEDLHINAAFIFLLYLFQTVSSYLFFAYKSSIVRAHQKEYKLTVISYGFTIGTNVLQILSLVYLRNFILYTVIVIAANVLQNLTFARAADNMYPYINDKIGEKLPVRQVKELLKDSYSLFLYKINSVVINATDNMVLSALIGLEIVGRYSNYLMIVTTIKTFLKKFYQAITAGLGSLHAAGNREKQMLVFGAVNLVTFWLYGIAAVGVAVVGDEFIATWISREHVIAQWVYNGRVIQTPLSLLIAAEIYLFGVQTFLSKFRNTMGLFQQAKYRPVFGIFINMAVSVAAAPKLGAAGVVLGTVLASLLTFMWFDPLIIFKHGFQKSVRPYYLRNIGYAAVVAAAGAASHFVCSMLPGEGWVFLILHAVACVAVSGVIFLAVSFRRKEFMFLLRVARNVLAGKKKTAPQ